MKLSTYMQAHSLSPKDVAQAIGVRGIATIYRYISGDRYPSSHVLRRIYKFTNGEVTANDFFHHPTPTHDQKENRA